MVASGRVELPTLGLGVPCSIRLSYEAEKPLKNYVGLKLNQAKNISVN